MMVMLSESIRAVGLHCKTWVWLIITPFESYTTADQVNCQQPRVNHAIRISLCSFDHVFKSSTFLTQFKTPNPTKLVSCRASSAWNGTALTAHLLHKDRGKDQRIHLILVLATTTQTEGMMTLHPCSEQCTWQHWPPAAAWGAVETSLIWLVFKLEMCLSAATAAAHSIWNWDDALKGK